MSLHLFAGLRVRDFKAARSWYERLLGEPTFFPHDTEAVWTLAEDRSVYIVEDADRAGNSVVTLFVDDLDASVAAIAARGFPAAVSARVPLRVTDHGRPANAGSWQLTVAEGTGTLTPNGTMSPRDPLTLGPRGLAALYAGIPPATLRLAGLASGGSPDADAALDAAFAATPYMLDEF